MFKQLRAKFFGPNDNNNGSPSLSNPPINDPKKASSYKRRIYNKPWLLQDNSHYSPRTIQQFEAEILKFQNIIQTHKALKESRTGQITPYEELKCPADIKATFQENILGPEADFKASCVACGDGLTVYKANCASAVSALMSASYYNYYMCPNDKDHSHIYCSSCFCDYVKYCADYYVQNKLPLKCSITSCKCLVSDAEIRRIVLSIHKNKSLYQLYEKASLYSGLADCSKQNNVPIVCRKCNVFQVLFPADYKERATNFKLLQYKEREAEQEAERKFAFASVVSKAGQVQPAPIVQQQYMPVQSWYGESIPPPPSNLILAPVVEGDSVPVAPPLPGYSDLIQHREEEARRKEEERIKKSVEEEEKKRLECEAAERKLKELEESLPPAPPKLIKQESEGVLTSPFFDCELDGCGGSTCLICNASVEKSQQESHLCNADEAEKFYKELLELLAMASSKKCPGKCGKRVKKDFSCQHMTCDSSGCATVWCYMCEGIREKFPGGNFTEHNAWTFESDDSQRCPMYTQYQYGNCAIMYNRFYEGDAKASLERYHIDLQYKALKQWKASKSPQDLAVIEAMIAEKFGPGGVVDERELFCIQECEAIREIWRKEKDQIKRDRLVAELRLASTEKKGELEQRAKVAAEWWQKKKSQNPALYNSKLKGESSAASVLSTASAAIVPSPKKKYSEVRGLYEQLKAEAEKLLPEMLEMQNEVNERWIEAHEFKLPQTSLSPAIQLPGEIPTNYNVFDALGSEDENSHSQLAAIKPAQCNSGSINPKTSLRNVTAKVKTWR
jgi:hypothetical protein